jgi:threonine dehydrogenase-like Zn-dependent dehydrogenase
MNERTATATPAAATSAGTNAGTMAGVILPGGRAVEWRNVPIPHAGDRQVVVRIGASSICGSDIRAIYREHLGHGPEAYQDVIAGHEPSGEIVEVGPECRRLRVGDRVAVYHIAGCGMCEECRRGYMIGCTDASRAAYGWQRDGGHAPYMLADEVTCLPLPDELTFIDGACVACGFGTAYEALLRVAASGRDRLLVTGLGPVGLGVAMLARGLGVRTVVGTDLSASRRDLGLSLGLVDVAVDAADRPLEAVADASDGGVETAIDASGSAPGRLLTLESVRTRGRVAWVGEGGSVTFDVSPLLIHKQVTVHGSWVTSLDHMAELLDRLVRWNLHPEDVVTARLPLSDAAEGYRLADSGEGGKVALIPDGEPAVSR